MNKIQQQDIADFVASFDQAESLRDKSFLITGSTGLIGATLVHSLLALNVGITIIAPVRNLAKAQAMYGKDEQRAITWVECDITSFSYNNTPRPDFIVHCAAPTSSRYMVEHPVETFDTILQSTRQLLCYARNHAVKAMVFLSSLEVYGTINDDTRPVTEDIQGYVSPTSVRSSYPMAKRAAENLCHLYAHEYGVNVVMARLTQTFGAGVSQEDNRVYAQFARSIIDKKDIILHSTGDSSKPYLYTMDCVSAILTLLLKGEAGEAYNVANDQTYISIRDMASLLVKEFGSLSKVRIELEDNHCYAPPTKLRLDSTKLASLGWKPRYGFIQMFDRLISSIRDTEDHEC